MTDTPTSAAEADLQRLLATMSPRHQPGHYVFVTLPEQAGPAGPPDRPAPAPVAVLASIIEAEGVSVLTTAEDAARAGLDHEVVLGWITLEVRSALTAVGLTAAVSAALTDLGISCNVVAGRHHDHLLVPVEQVARALAALRALSATAAATAAASGAATGAATDADPAADRP